MQPSAPALVSGIPFLGLLASMAMLPVLAPWFLASADRTGAAFACGVMLASLPRQRLVAPSGLVDVMAAALLELLT